MIEDLTLGTMRVSVRDPEGHTTDYGRADVFIRDGQATAVRRQMTIASGMVASVETPGRKAWEFVMADGAVWSVTGCGCGS